MQLSKLEKNPMISKEEYAALREQIIAELKEEKRARDQARIKLLAQLLEEKIERHRKNAKQQ